MPKSRSKRKSKQTSPRNSNQVFSVAIWAINRQSCNIWQLRGAEIWSDYLRICGNYLKNFIALKIFRRKKFLAVFFFSPKNFPAGIYFDRFFLGQTIFSVDFFQRKIFRSKVFFQKICGRRRGGGSRRRKTEHVWSRIDPDMDVETLVGPQAGQRHGVPSRYTRVLVERFQHGLVRLQALLSLARPWAHRRGFPHESVARRVRPCVEHGPVAGMD